LPAPQKKAFDAFAADYDALQHKNLGPFGKDLNVFARYKVEMTRHLIQSDPTSILEFGCGTGRNLPFLREAFPKAAIWGCDISAESLSYAAQRASDVSLFVSDSTDILDAYKEEFDLVFLAGVLHHIPASERESWMQALAGTLHRDGRLVVFEHNPWNPLTRHLVNTCPYDADAELVWPRDCRCLIEGTALKAGRVRYTLLFPWRPSSLVAVERLLDRFPLGGQYCVIAHRQPLGSTS
jgi:SAM-dependent methyltransferase